MEMKMVTILELIMEMEMEVINENFINNIEYIIINN